MAVADSTITHLASSSYADQEPTRRYVSPQRMYAAKSATMRRDAKEVTKIDDPKTTPINIERPKVVTKTDDVKPVTRIDDAKTRAND